jgi:predicted GH43/DUF377 family glycosyl hydrolase
MLSYKIATKPNSITLNSLALVPPAWQQERPASDYFVFNPAIYPHQTGWLLVYRVVAPRYAITRIAACHLDGSFNIIPGTITPLSDTIIGPNQGIGDPRLVSHQGRLWMIYCHFWPVSHLYLVEIEAGSLTAKGPARFLTLSSRQLHERNWMLFSHEDELLAVYTISPHVILRLNLEGQTEISCERLYITPWETTAYSQRYGELRGGAPPVRVGDTYYAFFHSSGIVGWLHPLLKGTYPWVRGRVRGFYIRYFVRRRYTGGFYGFMAKPPFAPTCLSPQPVLTPQLEPQPLRRKQRLNPIIEQVVYPAGAVLDDQQRWVVAYGVHDEFCNIRTLDHTALLRGVQPSGLPKPDYS